MIGLPSLTHHSWFESHMLVAESRFSDAERTDRLPNPHSDSKRADLDQGPDSHKTVTEIKAA